MKKVISKKVAKLVATSLSKLLVLEANSTSCLVLYEPRTPNKLERYRKGKTQ
nr:cyclic lactone autoinducer peptide [uncultured Mediterraneibacter sp.]